MSEPNTFEFAVISYRPLGSSGAYTVLCGIQSTGFTGAVASNDRYVRDCGQPAIPPVRKVRVTGRSWEITGSGLANVDQMIFDGLLAVKSEYKYTIMDISDPINTPEGTELGAWTGNGYLTSAKYGTTENDDASVDVTIASDGTWSYTPAA